MRILTGIDVLGIQRFVFGSNRLRDVLSASHVVAAVTGAEALTGCGAAPDQVLLAAGGNAVLEFDSLAAARAWTTCYTRWVLDEAPGLEVAVAHLDRGERSLAWGLQALQQDLARVKLGRSPNAAMLGLGVTAACAETGLPASGVNQGQQLSAQILGLRGRAEEARERWDTFAPDRFAFPVELDQMGRSYGDTSLIGVVHMDGNGVGKQISAWAKRCEGAPDEEVRAQYKAWSSAIDALGEAVLRAIVTQVAESVHDGEVCGAPEHLGFKLRASEEGKSFLPLRPLLLGGDDLTFVCDGRVALDLAVAGLRAFEAGAPIPHLGESGGEVKLSACAGVALARPHAPFHRSYELSEALCQSAKRARRDKGDKGAWLDWHVGDARPGEAVEAVRARQYGGGRTMRPMPLAGDKGWAWLEDKVLGPARQGEDHSLRGDARWSGSRSRAKQLSALVVEGPDAVKRQVEAWRATERELALPQGLGDDGRCGDKTPLLDALELIDLHLRLEPGQAEEGR